MSGKKKTDSKHFYFHLECLPPCTVIQKKEILKMLKEHGYVPPKYPLSRVQLSIVRHAQSPLEMPALVKTCEPILNSLVELGFLKANSWAVTGEWDLHQRYMPAKDGIHIEVLIQTRPGLLF